MDIRLTASVHSTEAAGKRSVACLRRCHGEAAVVIMAKVRLNVKLTGPDQNPEDQNRLS